MTDIELSELLLPQRVERIEEVLSHRTRQLTVLVESIHKGHNESAILRSCDAFGVQDVHVISSSEKRFRPKRSIARGSQKWVDIHRYQHTKEAIEQLRADGYQIWASHLGEASVPLQSLDLTGKVVLAFGNEKEGISQEMVDACDGCFKIPMLGFAQSFNVSVAVAISLYEAVQQRVAAFGSNGDLPDDEKDKSRYRLWQRGRARGRRSG